MSDATTIDLPSTTSKSQALRLALHHPANAVRTQPAELSPSEAGAMLRQLLVSPAATLTMADRERIRHAMRSLRLVADRLEEALDSNLRVDALNAATLSADASIVCASISVSIGRQS